MYGDSGDDRCSATLAMTTMRGGMGDDYTEGNQDIDTISDADQDDVIGGAAAGSADAGDILDGGAQQDYMAGDNALISSPWRADHVRRHRRSAARSARHRWPRQH